MWYLTVDLICISVRANYAEHLVCLVPIHTFSWVKCPYIFFFPFFNWVVCYFLYLSILCTHSIPVLCQIFAKEISLLHSFVVCLFTQIVTHRAKVLNSFFSYYAIFPLVSFGNYFFFMSIFFFNASCVQINWSVCDEANVTFQLYLKQSSPSLCEG